MLKSGGRFAVSDVVFLGNRSRIPAEVMRSVELWSGCVAGALENTEYEELLPEAGFEDVSVEVTRTYGTELAASGCCGVRVSKRSARFSWPAPSSVAANRRHEGRGD